MLLEFALLQAQADFAACGVAWELFLTPFSEGSRFVSEWFVGSEVCYAIVQGLDLPFMTN